MPLNKITIYYEVHSGIMDYRTGNWVKMDPVSVHTSLISAREEMHIRIWKAPKDQNACYIVRRYLHGNQNTTEAMEGVR